MPDDILLVQPPVDRLGFTSASGIGGVLTLGSVGHRAVLFDAGLDFYRFMLAADQLHQTMTILIQRIAAGELGQADAETRNLIQSILSQEQQWRRQMEETPAVAARLQSDAFFDPTQAAIDLQHLDRMLALISAACYPSRFSRWGFHHPDLNDWSDVMDFIERPQENPFMRYGLAANPPVAAGSAKPDLVVLWVARAGQVAPAASLMAAWTLRWPEMVLTAAGDPSWVEAVHAAAGVSRPGDLRPELKHLWETVQSHWMAATGVLTSPEFSLDDHFAMPAGPGPGFAIHPLHADTMAKVVAQGDGRELKTIVWLDPRGELKTITSHLYAVARQGSWNHLVLPDAAGHPLVESLIEFAAVNPNIVHSWCRRGPAPSRFSDPLDRLPQGSPRYGQTAPLPGMPLWQILRDSVYLAAFQQRLGANTLMQLRMDPADSNVYEIGRQLEYHFARPDELPQGYLDEICRMVEAGGSVGTQWLRHNLERAFLIAYVQERGVIVGNSSLKHPRKEYIQAVSAQSGLDLRGYLERGYTSVRPEYRGFGIGAKLLEGLTERAQGHKIFSIIGEDNIATQKMAIRNRTRRVASFLSPKAGKKVGVWIPEWMLPEGIDLPPQPDFSDSRRVQ